MSINKPEVVVPHRCQLGEGPVWDSHHHHILWLDIVKGEIHQYSPVSDQHEVFKADEMIGCIALREGGGLIAGMEHGIAFIDLVHTAVQHIATPEQHLPGNRFNEGKCDPEGRFWAGTMAIDKQEGAGTLYKIDSAHIATPRITGVTISNGLAWSPDQRTLYYTDTPTKLITAYDYNGISGAISNKRTAIDMRLEQGNPDGMTIDSEGMLWIAHWGGWQVSRWDPATAQCLLRIALPVAHVSSCTFGGITLNDLYITSAQVELTEEELQAQPLAGSLFIVRNCGFEGIEAFEFKG